MRRLVRRRRPAVRERSARRRGAAGAAARARTREKDDAGRESPARSRSDELPTSCSSTARASEQQGGTFQSVEAFRAKKERSHVELTHLGRSAFAVFIAASILAACGGGVQSPSGGPVSVGPPGAPAAIGVAGQADAAQRSAGQAARPDRKRKKDSGALVYTGGDASTYVLSYPSGRLVANIAEKTFGMCSDANGDVFLTHVNSIDEFPHGGTTPIATYTVYGSAYSCSIDPATGNIAAVVFCTTGCGDVVTVIQPSTNIQTTYADPTLPSLLFCTYDNQGNLFVDGYNGPQFGIAELPAGQTALANISLTQNIQFADQIQWDGQYLAVEARIDPVIYQIALAGSVGTVVNTVTLNGIGHRAMQSWIQKGKIGIPTAPSGGNRRAEDIF